MLKDVNIETPAQEAGVMLCHILKCGRAFLYAHGDSEISQEDKDRLDLMLAERIDNVPLQYIVGDTEFMSLRFQVSPAVLIPRQDTELLAEKAIELVNGLLLRKQKSNTDTEVRVLDMCTGSGCVAVSIAYFCPKCSVVACDVSHEALAVAKVNGRLNGVQSRVEFYCGDLFAALGDEQKFDVIVSNPPYIETNTIDGLQKEVRNYEPILALDGGADGLDFYREIIGKAPYYLNKHGWLAFEIGYNQGKLVEELMKKFFTNIEVLKDLGGNDRVVMGQFSYS
ncbi:MAG TPA: peptide chain release factor N(5)-glutamine methyltransferase [Ruminiclostridium sp.]|nr:peptide chain release factor N(5)-glutamine methyltransferase [Ruminiclostridium sp.]